MDATVYGVYDYWLGGHTHFAADREVGKAIGDRFPSVPVLVNAAQDFHLRAAAWCAQQGAENFIRLGTATWLPERNLHDAVRRVNPAARVAYTVRQTDALAIAEGLLGGGDGTTVFQGAPGDPASVLSSPPVAEMLADGKPACVIFALVLHFAPAARAAEVVAEYAAALPPGSCVAVSVMTTADKRAARELRRMFTPWQIRPWSTRDARRVLARAGLRTVAPHVVPVQEWPARTRWAGPPLEGPVPVRIAGAVARKD